MVDFTKDNQPTDEKMQILRMIEEGKVTAQEGLELLNALDLGKEEIKKSSDVKWLRVKVKAEDDRTKVNVNIPISLVSIAFSLAKKHAPELKDENLDEILEAIKSGAEGKIVDIYNEEDGTTVEVFIE